MRRVVADYLSFSKKELNGISVLLILSVLVLIIPVWYPTFMDGEEYDFTEIKLEAERFRSSMSRDVSLQKKIAGKMRISTVGGSITKNATYFDFDPNQLSDELWLKLGLSPKQIRVIRNYELKGGKFLKKEDLKKIYSISSRQYQSLEPYIQFKDSNKPGNQGEYKVSSQSQANSRSQIKVLLELNGADSVQLLAVRGIGPVFASRIIRFKNRLGGFYDKKQLLEVYGLDSLRYNQIKDLIHINSGLIRTIDLNTFKFDEVKKHPYLTYKQMNAILQYRMQHGPYKSMDELKNIAILNEEIIRKIAPYFEIRP